MREEVLYDLDRKTGRPKKVRGWVIWLVIIGIIFTVGLLLSLVSCQTDKDGFAKVSGPYVGVVGVEGTIAEGSTNSWGIPVGYQHRWTLDTIDSMMQDSDNRGILLFVNSPGGGIYESDELYLKLLEYKERTKRPVYAYMSSMAASGGYYVSAPADKILANRNCWTGSIGVTIGTFFDVSGLLENYGVKTVTITSGANKAMGSYVEPMTQQQKAIFQGLVDEAYDQFVSIVAKERDMEPGDVRALADGRIYTARQAEANGLIDGVCTYEEAIRDMKKSYDLQHCDFVDFYYVDHSFFGRLLGNVQLPAADGGDAQALLTFIEKQKGFPIGYICDVLR